ncbi:cache domain-containing protein, partial [bacterium]|nr:cache domain-containing protein [bacterium]
MNTFFIKIILPTLLAILLFVTIIFGLIVPTFKKTLLDDRRTTIRELTDSAWSVLDELEKEERTTSLTREMAQKRAIDRIRDMRYGAERKDYFWITDMHPTMVVHPYVSSLNGKDLSQITDSTGKKLFVEFVNVVKRQGGGYVTYEWQWKDDQEHIVPKLSYVKGFMPWGWVIGTGVYIEDVKKEIAILTKKVLYLSLFVTIITIAILLFITLQSLRIEKRRRRSNEDLKESQEKYKMLVESSTEGLMMILSGTLVYSNGIIQKMCGYGDSELKKMALSELFKSGEGVLDKMVNGTSLLSQFETELLHKSGAVIRVILSLSEISIKQKEGVIVMVKDLSKESFLNQKEREQQREELFVKLTVDTAKRLSLSPTPEDVATLHRELFADVLRLISYNPDMKNLTRVMTFISDQILNRLIHFALVKLGKPPVKFAFITLGSEGREEETLLTDQDNALVYEDVSPEMRGEVSRYFLNLGTMVCEWLDMAGYTFCQGKIMASNPEWNQSLSQWKSSFSHWINEPNSQDLLELNIFFDFRCSFGQKSLVDELREDIESYLSESKPFFLHFAKNALFYDVPKLGVFSVKNAMKPLVNFARIYALKNSVSETNTFKRLESLYNQEVITAATFEETIQSYRF